MSVDDTFMSFLRRIFQRATTQNAGRISRPNAEKLIEQAHRAQHAEQYDDALELLSQAMEHARQDYDSEKQVDITLVRGDILIAQGDYNTANFILQELYEDCLGKQYTAPMAYALVSLGVVAQCQGDWETAREKYEEARSLAKNAMLEGALGRATARLASVYMHDGNDAFALHLLQDAIPRLQRSGDKELLGRFMQQLGELHIRLDNEAEALRVWGEALEFARLLQDRQQITALHMLMGNQAVVGSRYEDARKHYTEALSLAPIPRPKTAQGADLLCRLSDVLLRQGDTITAEAQAQEALEIARHIDDATLLTQAKIALGTALLRQNPTSEKGRLLLHESVNIDAASVTEEALRAVRTLAQANILAGDQETGEKLLRDALLHAGVFPLEEAHIQASLGTLLRESNSTQALKHFERAIEIYISVHRTEQVARLYTEIGALHTYSGEGRRAVKEYEKALVSLNDVQDAPTRGIVLGNVATAYSDYGDMDSAQDFFVQSIEIAQQTGDKSAEAIRRGNYGRLLALINEPRKAITELMQAQNLSDELGLSQLSATQQAGLGLAYFGLGNVEDAIERYETSLASLESLALQAIVRADLADAYAVAGRSEEAVMIYEQALRSARDQKTNSVIGQCLVGLANLALNEEDIARAEKLLDEAEPLLRRAYLRRWLAHLLAARSRVQQMQGNAEQAQQFWEESRKLQRMMQMPPMEANWLEHVEKEI